MASLLDRIRRVLSPLPQAVPRPSAASSAAAAYWDNWQREKNAAGGQWHDWGEHPVLLRLIQNSLFGSPDTTVFDYLKRRYPDFSGARALSLCSGDGGFERMLVERGVFGHITGVDISSERVRSANERHGDLGGQLRFITGDVNAGDFGTGVYDAVFAKAALHHVEALERLFAGLEACLRPGGRLVTIDFFGPTRFQWGDDQLDYANRLLREIPAELRRRHDGTMKEAISRPTVEEMIAADPSEAVRSSEVHGFIRRHFDILEEFDIGGTLLNLVFTPDIINNFQPGDSGHEDVLQRAFAEERKLMAGKREVPSDFKLIVAARR